MVYSLFVKIRGSIVMQFSEKIINAFNEECADLLGRLEENIVRLEKDPENFAVVDDTFRIVHSLKSESAIVGYNNFSQLSHASEDLFHKIKKSEVIIDENIIDIFYLILEEYKSLYQLILTKNSDQKDIEHVLNVLSYYKHVPMQEKIEAGPVMEEIILSPKEIDQLLQKKYANIFIMKIKLFDNIALKYARAFLLYSNLTSVGEVVKATVNFEKQEEDNRYTNFSIVFLTNKKEKEIYDLVDISEVERISLKKVITSKEEIESTKGEEAISPSIRVNLEKIDMLMNTVGELTVNYNRVEKLYEILNNKNFEVSKSDKNNFLDIITQWKRLITGLQDDVMKIRMVPIKTLFNKYPRLIKTLSKDLNKKVKLSIKGETTEIDKTIAEEIREPLTHLIRNAVDHGIEPPEERKKKGKPEEGTIIISSYHSGNNILIEISDDGAGIDPESIKQKIIKNKYLPKEKVDDLTEKQIFSFLFLSGFSTRDNVTELSGRGVGMDVLKNNVKKLGGHISIITKKDKGTMMIVAIPITVAIMTALVVHSGGIYFAIPLYFIQETLRIFEKEINIVDQYEVIHLRKKILSLLRLNEMFHLVSQTEEVNYRSNLLYIKQKKERKRVFVVVVNFGNKKIGLIVDRLIAEQDVVIKPLSKYVEGMKGMIGVTILGDGNIAYIMDPTKLITDYLQNNSIRLHQKISQTAS